MKNILKYVLTTVSLFFYSLLYSQNCLDYGNIPVLDCSKCTHVVSSNVNHINIASNETLCVTGHVVTSSINFSSNSFLVVCGVLEVSNLNISNNNYVFVHSSGTLQTTSIVVGSNGYLYNRGIVESQNININNNGHYYNVGVGAITTFYSSLNVNGSLYNYYGCLGGVNLNINRNSTICVGYNSVTYATNNFNFNSIQSVINYKSTDAHFVFSGTVSLNSLFADTKNIYVCLKQGTTVNNPSNWGTANMVYKCDYNCPLLAYQSSTQEYLGGITLQKSRLMITNDNRIVNHTDLLYTLYVYDLSLRNIYKKDNIQDKEFYLDLLTTNQFLILHFIFEDGYVETIKHFGPR